MNLLTNEQIAYLKSLDSKKKRREFLLDCLVENVIGESEKIDPSKVMYFKNGEFKATSQEQIDFLSGFKGNLFTTTTAPRTLEGFPNKYEIQDEAPNIDPEVLKKMWDSTMPKKMNASDIEIIRGNYDVKYTKNKSEEYKWDKNPKLEDIIKSKLIIRGFKNEDLLNSRGLICATIDEMVIEVVKNYQSANENTEAKFTKEDLKKAFEASFVYCRNAKYRTFNDYFKSIEK